MLGERDFCELLRENKVSAILLSLQQASGLRATCAILDIICGKTKGGMGIGVLKDAGGKHRKQ